MDVNQYAFLSSWKAGAGSDLVRHLLVVRASPPLLCDDGILVDICTVIVGVVITDEVLVLPASSSARPSLAQPRLTSRQSFSSVQELPGCGFAAVRYRKGLSKYQNYSNSNNPQHDTGIY